MRNDILVSTKDFDFMVKSPVRTPFTNSWKREIVNRIHVFLMGNINGETTRKTLCHVLGTMSNERDDDVLNLMFGSIFKDVYIVDTYDKALDLIIVQCHDKNGVHDTVITNPIFV